MAKDDTINKKNEGETTPPVEPVVTSPVVPTEKKGAKEGEVSIPQSKLTEILHIIEELRKSDIESKKEIERLTYAADNNRLARFDATEASKKALVPKCKVSFWDKKLVLAWKMQPQEVYFGPGGVYHEKQDVEMTIQGESKPVVVPYKDYFKYIVKKEADILSRSTDNDGNTTFVLELEDGKQISLDSNFIN